MNFNINDEKIDSIIATHVDANGAKIGRFEALVILNAMEFNFNDEEIVKALDLFNRAFKTTEYSFQNSIIIAIEAVLNGLEAKDIPSIFTRMKNEMFNPQNN
jgi:hypothetical protein